MEVRISPDELEPLIPVWDTLAVAASSPNSAPAWGLAWYRHGLPAGAAPRVITVTEGDDLIGICPMFVVRTGFGLYRYALAAPSLCGLEPLAVRGREHEVHRAIGKALASCDPVPDIVALDWLPATSGFSQAVRMAWGRPQPSLIERALLPSPRVVHRNCDFDTWLAGRSAKFRQVFRSDYRKIQAHGFEHRVSSTPADIAPRLPSLQRLYEGRRRMRDGAGVVFDDSLSLMLVDAIGTSPPGRVWLSTLERSDEMMSGLIFLSAGGLSRGWMSGFDDAWVSLGPTRVNLVLSVEESIRRQDDVLDLGGGDQAYKYRFTDDAVVLQHMVLARRGLLPFHSAAQLLPYRTRQSAVRAVGRAKTAVTTASGTAKKLLGR